MTIADAETWLEIRKQNRRAKLRIDAPTLGRLLGLPDDVYVSYIGADSVGRPSIVVVVEGPNLEPQPHDIELPDLAGSWSVEMLYHSEPGSDDPPQAYVRWGWAPDPQTAEATS